jgi:predicted transcriptional regulator
MIKRADHEIIDLLVSMGLSRKAATTLTFLSHKEETDARQIERNTELRQPEVSTAIKELYTLGWIEKRDMKGKGRGRPIHFYRLNVPLDIAIKTIVDGKKTEIEQIEVNIKRLKELTR